MKIDTVNHKGEWCSYQNKLLCQEGYCSECAVPNQKRILLDIDGVVVSYDFADLVWQKFHVRIDPSKIFAYNLSDALGVSSNAIDEMFHDQVWGKPDFISGALSVLNDWKSKEYEIVIYSNRVKYMGYDKLARWLIDWGIPFSGINGGQGLYDYHIDDRPEKLRDARGKFKLLYTQPWNLQCLNIENELIRVNNWDEIKDIVK